VEYANNDASKFSLHEVFTFQVVSVSVALPVVTTIPEYLVLANPSTLVNDGRKNGYKACTGGSTGVDRNLSKVVR
jgi:hypothetical protein